MIPKLTSAIISLHQAVGTVSKKLNSVEKHMRHIQSNVNAEIATATANPIQIPHFTSVWTQSTKSNVPIDLPSLVDNKLDIEEDDFNSLAENSMSCNYQFNCTNLSIQSPFDKAP